MDTCLQENLHNPSNTPRVTFYIYNYIIEPLLLAVITQIEIRIGSNALYVKVHVLVESPRVYLGCAWKNISPKAAVEIENRPMSFVPRNHSILGVLIFKSVKLFFVF